jgi:hypothetical protein
MKEWGTAACCGIVLRGPAQPPWPAAAPPLALDSYRTRNNPVQKKKTKTKKKTKKQQKKQKKKKKLREKTD